MLNYNALEISVLRGLVKLNIYSWADVSQRVDSLTYSL